MEVTCEICGHVWNQQDPEVRFVYGDGRWECRDEVQCFGRRAIVRALEHAFSQMPPAVPVR
jgi:hypothetical protein